MPILTTLCGVVLIVIILWEGFETIILPRRVTRRFRLTRLFYRSSWHTWSKLAATVIPEKWQDTWLSVFGPLSILLLLSIWAFGLILGFSLLHWAAGSAVIAQGGGSAGFWTDLYLSGTTFFTLGLGDVVPRSGLARFLVVIESGLGFAFLALVISYLPPLNQSFSHREASISLLDSRAGSPPTGGEILRRHTHEEGEEALRQLLAEWELWSAEVLEGYLSYPILAYFRSQHDNESWIAALAAILDCCALVMVGPKNLPARQAELTFAMARHTLVDLCVIFRTWPRPPKEDRLAPDVLSQLRVTLAEAGIRIDEGEAVEAKLKELRDMYEPQLTALGAYFLMDIPPFVAPHRPDNWQGNVRRPGRAGKPPGEGNKPEHF